MKPLNPGLGRAAALCVLAAAPLRAYDSPAPRFINVDLTWRDAGSGTNRTSRGQLWFKDFPVREGDRVRGFGKLGYYTGIKWFVPRRPGEIWIAAAPPTNPPAFLLHDHFGEKTIVPAFDWIDVVRTEDARLEKHLDEQAATLVDGGPKSGAGFSLDNWTLDGTEPEGPVIPTAAPPERGGRSGQADAAAQRSPLQFATAKEIGAARIRMGDIARIAFLDAADGCEREMYKGRFVQFSNEARGDDGRVQVVAATYFGGPDENERFSFGEFLSGGAILLAGDFRDLGFLKPGLVTVLGRDPPADAYPDVQTADKRGKTRLYEPRRTVTMAYFSADLARLERVVRLPWGAGTLARATVGPDDAVYVSGTVGPHFDAFAADAGCKPAVVENPAALAAAADARRPREPGPDGFVAKFAAPGDKIAWLVRFKHARADIFLRPDSRLLARRGDELFFVEPDGSVSGGPALDIAGSNMAVDPRTGDMYFCGSYRSGTGLEPYVCPYVYKVAADGRQAWTAYGWSGPIAGVEQHRLVSDSSVSRVKVSEDGSLTLTGWSDGGNTVLSYQPYDMRQTAPGGGFCSSAWGATGGLTVRIAHIIHMDPVSMEVDYCTRYVSYLPTSDVPTLLNIYDMQRLPSGDVAITGGSWTGYVETHDAWVTPWYVEHRTNEHAQARGGTIFTLFAPDFTRPRMATRTPGVAGAQLAGRGNLLLLYSGVTPGRLGEPCQPIVRNAFQATHGGGLDGYAMLIDTQGPPNPPRIPDVTWGDAGKGKQQ